MCVCVCVWVRVLVLFCVLSVQPQLLLITSIPKGLYLSGWSGTNWSVCVCVCERERERESAGNCTKSWNTECTLGGAPDLAP